MNNRIDYGEILYDYRNTGLSRRRKEKANMLYKKDMKRAFFVFLIIDIIVTVFFISIAYHSSNMIVTITFFLVLYFLLIPTHFVVFYRLTNYKESASLDVIVTKNGIFMEQWDFRFPPGKLRFYPWKYIDRIYWNEGWRHALIIKSELGWRRTDRRYRSEPLKKTNIDNILDFKKALQKATRLIEHEKRGDRTMWDFYE